MQQSAYLVLHSSVCQGPALPGAAVPPKFGAGSRPSEHCSSIRRRLLTHAAPAHTSYVFFQLRVRGKQLILQKTPFTIYLEVLSHHSSDATKLRGEFSRDRAGLAIKLVPKALQHGGVFPCNTSPCWVWAHPATAAEQELVLAPWRRAGHGAESPPKKRGEQAGCPEPGTPTAGQLWAPAPSLPPGCVLMRQQCCSAHPAGRQRNGASPSHPTGKRSRDVDLVLL